MAQARKLAQKPPQALKTAKALLKRPLQAKTKETIAYET